MLVFPMVQTKSLMKEMFCFEKIYWVVAGFSTIALGKCFLFVQVYSGGLLYLIQIYEDRFPGNPSDLFQKIIKEFSASESSGPFIQLCPS